MAKNHQQLDQGKNSPPANASAQAEGLYPDVALHRLLRQCGVALQGPLALGRVGEKTAGGRLSRAVSAYAM